MTKLLAISGGLLLTPLLLAQGATPRLAPNLELRYVPTHLVNGVPRTFTFALTNISDHNVWIPDPTIQCSNALGGYVRLGVHFMPLKPPDAAEGIGCVVDEFDTPIFKRIQDWKMLRPGDSIEKTLPRPLLGYRADEPGAYDVWAEYHPPALSPADQRTLRERGVDFPVETLTTSHLTFRTNQ